MIRFVAIAAVALAASAAVGARAQTVALEAQPVVPAGQPHTVTLPAGTPVDFVIVNPINSKLNQPGDKFRIKLAAPITLNGATVVPADTYGVGEVIHAARARAGGKPGELILTARYIEFRGVQVPLRSFNLGTRGENKTTAGMITAALAGPFAYLIVGGEIDIPANMSGYAKTASEIVIPAP